MSSSLPDCRTPSLQFAPYRFPELSYGQSDVLGPDEQPWLNSHSRRFDKASWLALLEKRIAAPGNDGRLLVFIHGFNNSFEDALHRAIQVSRLNYPGVPVVVVNWPSREKAQSYTYDEASIEWAQDYVNDLLLDLAARSPKITLVAHSMGNRAAIRAVQNLNLRSPAIASHFDKIVLASADVDRNAVLRQGGSLDDLLKFNRKVLIYASYVDVPLKASRNLHGYARLGSSDCRFDVMFDRTQYGEMGGCNITYPRENFATVETSQVNMGGLLKHSDFVDSCATAIDLSEFLRGAGSFPFRERMERDGLVGYRLDAAKVDQSGLCPKG